MLPVKPTISWWVSRLELEVALVVLLVVGVARAAHGADDGHLRREHAVLGAEALDLVDEVAPRLEAADEAAAGLQLLESGWHGPSYSKCLRFATIGSEAATRAG